MGVKTSLSALTLLSSEVQAANTDFQDATGLLESCIVDAANLATKLTWIANAIGAGSNATAIEAQVTALS